MNTNNIYQKITTLGSGEPKKEEVKQSKEELDWIAWRTHPQTRIFMERMSEAQAKINVAAQIIAVSGDEKLLRALLVESLTINKIINLTEKGTYVSTNQS